MKIWIVFGTTGEYLDRTEWAVKAFRDQDRARKFEHECLDEGERIERYMRTNRLYRFDIGKHPELIHKLDSGFQLDYNTGTDYFIISVELEDDKIEQT